MFKFVGQLSHTLIKTWHHRAKNSLRILKDILLRNMKIAKATRILPTPWNWAAAQWLRLSSILKVRGQLRTGLSARAERYIQMLSLKDRRRSAVSNTAEIEELGISLLMHRRYAALYIKLVYMPVTPGGRLYWRWYIRKLPNSLLKTCQQSAWITGTISYGLMRWRLICLGWMASSMCGSDQERGTKISVSCLHSSMVVGMS